MLDMLFFCYIWNESKREQKDKTLKYLSTNAGAISNVGRNL